MRLKTAHKRRARFNVRFFTLTAFELFGIAIKAQRMRVLFGWGKPDEPLWREGQYRRTTLPRRIPDIMGGTLD
jgi:hypothetical protein